MVDRFEELWVFNIQGNYAQELQKLSSSIDLAKKDWISLAATFEKSGASFSRSKKEARALQKELDKLEGTFQRAAPVQEDLADSSQTLATASNQLVREMNRLNAARARELKVLDQTKRAADPQIIRMRAEAAAIQRLTREIQREAQAREFKRLAQTAGLKTNAEGTRLLDIEAEAAKRAAKAQERLALAEALRKKGLDIRGEPLKPPSDQERRRGLSPSQLATEDAARQQLDNTRRAAQLANKEFVEARLRARELDKQFKALDKTGQGVESTFNRVSFTFRRLIGIMAAFTVARLVVSEFNRMISVAIRFQGELEATRVGVSGLIAAAANIRSPQGGIIGIDQQLLESQRIAIDQMEKLKREALQTAASYQELAKAFQSAVAPGLQAGLTLDQIRKLTVNISQAATGIGLAQDQLAEEIRSLFQGTISPRNTRIAVALGISPQDITRARELGNLFEFLENRFRAIALTGKLLMNTFNGQLSQATDAFKLLLTESSKPLFEQLKASLQDIQKAIFRTTEDAIIFKPETLQAFKGLFDGLAAGVQGIRSAFSAIDVEGFQATMATIGQTIGLIGTLLANAFTVAFNAASPTFNILSGLISLLTKLIAAARQLSTPFTNLLGTFSGLVAKVLVFLFTSNLIIKAGSRIVGVFLKARAAVLAFAAASAVANTNLKSIQKVTLFITNNFKKMLIWVLAIVAAITLVDTILKALGVETGIFDFVNDTITKLSDGLDSVLEKVSGVKEELSEPVSAPFGIVEADFRDLKSDMAAIGNDLTISIKKSVKELQNSLRSIGLPNDIAQQLKEVFDLQRDFEFSDQIIEVDRTINSLRNRLRDLTQTEKRGILLESLKPELASKAIDKTIADARKEIARLSRTLPEGAVDIGRMGRFFSSDQLKENEGTLKKIRDLEAQIVDLNTQKTKVLEEKAALDKQADQIAVDEIVTERQLNDLLRERRALQEQINQQANIARRRSAETDIFSVQQATQVARLSAEEIRTQQAILARVGVSRAETAAKEVALAQERVRALQEEATLQRGIDALIRDRKVVANQSQEIDKETLKVLDKQIEIREQELDVIRTNNKERLKLAEIEARIAKLRETGSFEQGIGFGLQDFAAANDSLFDIGENFAKNFASNLAAFGGDAIAQSVAAAVDPERNFDLDEALGNFALRAGAELASQFIANLLSRLISLVGLDILGSSTFATTTVAAGAVFTNEVLLGALGFDEIVSLTGTAFIVQATAAGAAFAAASGAAGAATGGVGAIAASRGGAVDRAKRFRSPVGAFAGAKGFARGGRPLLGKDSRDTVPAWLRPGEWVMRPEAVKLYGDRIFDLLNRGVLPATELRGLAGSSKSPKMPRIPKRSFATGGPVVKGPSGRPGVTQVLQFHDEQTLSKALAAGPDSMARFTRTKRGSMRAALGLEPGS